MRTLIVLAFTLFTAPTPAQPPTEATLQQLLNMEPPEVEVQFERTAGNDDWLRRMQREQARQEALEAQRNERELVQRQLDYLNQEDYAKYQFRLCVGPVPDEETYARCWREYQINRPGFVD